MPEIDPGTLVVTSASAKLSTQMARKTYIVEHLDEELGPWSELEYITIAKESHAAGAKFCLSSVPSTLVLPAALKQVPGFTADERSVETLYAEDKTRVCLLDPSAMEELNPEDGDLFDVFLFGGILGEWLTLQTGTEPSLTLIRGRSTTRYVDHCKFFHASDVP